MIKSYGNMVSYAISVVDDVDCQKSQSYHEAILVKNFHSGLLQFVNTLSLHTRIMLVNCIKTKESKDYWK